MMDNYDYYDFRIQMITQAVTTELNFYERPDNPANGLYPLTEYVNYLRQRIGLDVEESDRPYNYDYNNRPEIKKMDMKVYNKDIELMMFSKPWSKIQEFHKIMKIDEFINNLEYGSKASSANIKKNREYLKEEINTGLKEKKFNKNGSQIEYNRDIMQIESISCIVYKKSKGLYQIDWSL